MANYKEQTISGNLTSWLRSYKVEIINNHLENPSIRFLEEKKTLMPDGSYLSKGNGALTEDYDPERVITLIHPETNQVIGQTTLTNLHVILYSYYIDLANKRDQGL
jgi:hypothetical protein